MLSTPHCAQAISLPLALLRNISSLRFTSVLSTAFLLFLGVALVAKAGLMGKATEPHAPVAFRTTFLDFFNGKCKCK